MRYVMFNLLVVGALAFLLFDGEPPKTVQGAVDKIAAKAERMVETGKQLVQPTETKTAPPAKPAKPETVVVERVPKPEPAKTVAKVAAPAPAAKTVAKAPVAKTAPPLPPEVAKRRAEVLGEAAPNTAVANAPEASPTFMTPRVRRGELAKLAEDMELLCSSRKMAR